MLFIDGFTRYYPAGPCSTITIHMDRWNRIKSLDRKLKKGNGRAPAERTCSDVGPQLRHRDSKCTHTMINGAKDDSIPVRDPLEIGKITEVEGGQEKEYVS